MKSNYEGSKEAPISDPENMNYGFCNEVLEIHGNIKYLRCDNNCIRKLHPAPPMNCPEYFVPECPKCKRLARYIITYLLNFQTSHTIL